jgi:hypothetical protein
MSQAGCRLAGDERQSAETGPDRRREEQELH